MLAHRRFVLCLDDFEAGGQCRQLCGVLPAGFMARELGGGQTGLDGRARVDLFTEPALEGRVSVARFRRSAARRCCDC